MLFHLGIICALLTTVLAYSHQVIGSNVFVEEEDTKEEDSDEEDYSDLEEDVETLTKEDEHIIN